MLNINNLSKVYRMENIFTTVLNQINLKIKEALENLLYNIAAILFGIVLCIVILLTEILTVKVIKNISIAEILHED